MSGFIGLRSALRALGRAAIAVPVVASLAIGLAVLGAPSRAQAQTICNVVYGTTNQSTGTNQGTLINLRVTADGGSQLLFPAAAGQAGSIQGVCNGANSGGSVALRKNGGGDTMTGSPWSIQLASGAIFERNTTGELRYTPSSTYIATDTINGQSATVLVSSNASVFPVGEVFIVNLTQSALPNYRFNPQVSIQAAEPEVTIAVSPTSVAEDGATNLTYTVTRSAASASSLTVNLNTTGTATSGTDYTGAATSVTIASNATTATVVLNPTADATVEADETAIVTVASGTGYTVGSPSSATGTITNDDVPSASIAVSPASVAEDGTPNLVYTITLDQAPLSATTVNFTVGGTATSGTDFAAVGTTAAFAIGATTAQVTVDPTADTTAEPDETVILTLASGTGYTVGTPSAATGTIANDEQPTLTINDVTVNEGASGTAIATFTVSLSSPALTGGVSFDIATANGTATAGSDYVGRSLTAQTIAAGASSYTFDVTVNGDAINEANETAFVNVTNVTGATLGDGQGQLTITNDDAQPALSIDDVTVTEGNAGTVNAVFTVSLNAASGQTVTVNYATANGTATSGSDYTAATGTLTFVPGDTSETVTVTVAGDTTVEADETFTVGLSGAANATIADNSGLGTIANDDVPDLSIADVTVTEGTGGTTNATFTVTLSRAAGPAGVAFDIATANGTAIAGQDFTGRTLTNQTIASGDTTYSFVVAITPDALDEINEGFGVNVTNVQRANVTDGTAAGTITDDDAPPSVSIGDRTVAEGASGQANASFTVTLSAASGQTVTVDYATANGTASAGSDYVATSGTLTFAPGGALTQSVLVPVNGDGLVEPDETFTVGLSNGVNVTIADGSGAGVITNDDFPVASVTVSPTSVLENSGQALTYTIALTPAPLVDTTVGYTVGGDAVAGTDYTGLSGSVLITANTTSATALATPTGDTTIENAETVQLTLSAGTGYTVGSPNAATGTIANDDSPNLTINDVTQAEGTGGSTNFTFTVSLSQAAPTGGVSFNIATADGTAVAGTDYTAFSQTGATIAAGASSATFVVAVTADALNEPNRQFVVNLSNATGATITDGQGVGTIQDDDGTPTFSVNSVSVTEGNTGTVTATFTVTQSAPSGQVTSVAFATGGGTATAGTDYQSAGGTLTFNPGGGLTQSVSVTVNGDFTVEGDETFVVTLSSPSNATLAQATGSGTITDDDAAPVVTGLSPSAGAEAGGTVVTLTGTALGGATAVSFGATPAASFTAVNANTVTATSPAGTGAVNVRVTTPVGTSATGAGNLFTYQPLPEVTVSVAPASASEAGGVLTYTVVLSAAPTSGSVTVNLTTGGTATSGADYTAPAATLTFNTGVSSLPVAVTLLNDALVEAPETLSLTVASGTGYLVGTPATATATITSDDQTTLSIAGVTQAEGNSGQTAATFQVSLSAPAGPGGVTFDVQSSAGTATAGVDYSAAAATGVTIAQGQSTYAYVAQIIGDLTPEADETFQVTVSNVTGVGVLTGTLTATGTITNDDTVPSVTALSPATGPQSGGTSVAITGADLSGTTAVAFGATPATSFTVNGPTSITATAPAGTGAVDVVVTTPSGTSVATTASRFTYTAPTLAAPTAANLTATAAYNPGGAGFTTIDLSAGAGGAVTGYAVGAAANGSVALVGSAARYTPVVGFSGTDTFTYTVTGPGGVSSPATVTVTVSAAVIAITPTSLPNGQRGVAYNANLSATGGQAPYAFTVSAGALPAGLTLSTAGALSGTPQASGSFAFTVRAQDSSTGAGPYAATQAYALTVAAPVVALSPAAGALPAGAVGAAYSQTLAASGAVAPYSFAVTAGALPAGLALASGGTLSGAPTASGSYSFTVTATDGSTAGSGGPYGGVAAYSLVVGDAAPAATASSLTVAYDAAATNVPLTLSGGPVTSVAVSTAPTRGVATASGATLTYTPTVGAFGTDTFAYVATGPGGSSAPATVTVTIGAPTLAIGPATLADGQEDVAYAATLTASGGAAPYSFTITAGALPAGVTLSSTGGLSGTPTAMGDYAFTVTATDTSTGSGPASVTRAFALRIAPPAPPVARTMPGTVSTEGGASGGEPTRIDLGALVIGDYTEIRIVTQPQNGTVVLEQGGQVSAASVGPVVAASPAATVSLAATPLAAGPRVIAIYRANAGYTGPDSFTFLAVGPGGSSSPAAVSIRVTGSPPVAANLIATTEQGRPVTVDLTGAATEGPFTTATVVSITPAGSATSALVQGGVANARTYGLTVTPRPDFEGKVVVTYTLGNSIGVSAPATVTVTVQARPNPSADPTVRALTTAQAQASRLFATTQLGNFNRRNEQLHGPGEGRGRALGVSVSSGLNGLLTTPMGDLPWTARENQLAADRVASLDDLSNRSGLFNGGAAGSYDGQAQDDSQSAAQGLGSGSSTGDSPRAIGSVSVWSGGAVTVGGFDQTTRTASFDVTTSGVSVGADIKLSEQLTVGGGGGFGTQRTEIGEDEDGRLDGDSWTGAVYGSWRPASGAFVDGVLGYGSLNFDTRRLAGNGRIADGEREGDMVMASLTSGWDRTTPQATLSTYGRFDYVSTTLDAYSETGADLYNLSFAEREFDSLTGALGVRGQVLRSLRSGVLTQSGRFEWRHEFSGLDGQRLDYADIGGFRYAIDGERWMRYEFAAELGLEVTYDSGLTLGVDVGARFSDTGDAATLRMLLAKRF